MEERLGFKRYSADRKHTIVTLIDYLGRKGHAQATADVLNFYGIGIDELAEWRRKLAEEGKRGLRITRKKITEKKDAAA